MKIYQFDKPNGKRINQFDSDFVMSHIIQTDKPVQIGCMYLEENGVIGYHQAVVPQLLLIMAGKGLVRSGEDGYVHVQPGDAVFWKAGEWHETKTAYGLTAVVIEGDVLDPGAMMPLKKQ